MTDLNIDFAYLLLFSVLQPARIQDVEALAGKYLGERGAAMAEDGKLREIHDAARENNWVIAVRKGVYVLSKDATMRIRTAALSSKIDNRRLFLLKSTRKAIV